METLALETMSRDELVDKARALGVDRPELMTRVELRDEIVRRSEPDPTEQRRQRGWLGVARDLVASVVESGLNLPDAAAIIRGGRPELELRGPPPVATVTLAQIYAAQGHTARALAVLDEVLDKEPDHKVARELRERFAQELAAGTRVASPVPPPPSAPPSEPAVPSKRRGAALPPVLEPSMATSSRPAPAETVSSSEPVPPVMAPISEPVPPATAPSEPASAARSSSEPAAPPSVEVAPPPPAAVSAEAAPSAAAELAATAHTPPEPEPALASAPPETPPAGALTRASSLPASAALPAVVVVRAAERAPVVCWDLGSAPLPKTGLVVRWVTVRWNGSEVELRERDLPVFERRGQAELAPLEPGALLRAALGVRVGDRFIPLAIASELERRGAELTVGFRPLTGGEAEPAPIERDLAAMAPL